MNRHATSRCTVAHGQTRWLGCAAVVGWQSTDVGERRSSSISTRVPSSMNCGAAYVTKSQMGVGNREVRTTGSRELSAEVDIAGNPTTSAGDEI